MINLDQIRAHRAFTQAYKIKEEKQQAKEYLSLARTLPSMFSNNGFLATWAFLLSKKDKNPHCEAVLNSAVEHFHNEDFDLGMPDETDPYRLFVDHWTDPDHSIDTQGLMALTRESILFSGWIKRAAETLCDE